MRNGTANWRKKIEVWWLLRDIKKMDGYKCTTISWGENGSRGRITVQISVRDAKKYARFIYTQTDSVTNRSDNFDYKVPIVETLCHFGGVRYWFECPLSKNNQQCGRRVGVLYKKGDLFGCRQCHKLTYISQRENRRCKTYSMYQVLELDMKIEKLSEKKDYIRIEGS
jgi:hypothetical protein